MDILLNRSARSMEQYARIVSNIEFSMFTTQISTACWELILTQKNKSFHLYSNPFKNLTHSR